MTRPATLRPRSGLQTGQSATQDTPGRPDALSDDSGLSRDIVLAAMSEREFQNHVVEGLKRRGFVVFVFPEMRLTRAGWPDLTFVHPRAFGRIWFWELKRQTGRVRPEQLDLLRMLGRGPGVDARIVRPSDWEWLRDKLDYERRGLEPLAAPETSQDQ